MPQENLPGSSCRMNAAEILFLRVWEKHHSGKNSTAAAMETRLQLRASSWSGFPRPVLLQLQGKRIGQQTAGNIQ